MNICSGLLSPRDSDGACLHRLQAAKMEKIYLYLKHLKVALFLLMQIILAVCVEITVYNKGFMTRRQRSRSPSWPHWQCRTVKPFYGGDKKLPVSQLDSERGKINWTLMPPSVINTEQIHITVHRITAWTLQYRLYHLKHLYRDIIIDSSHLLEQLWWKSGLDGLLTSTARTKSLTGR